MGNTAQKSQETEVEEPGQLQQEEDSNFTCEICIEPMLAIRKFKNGSLCKHPFCLDCVAKYIEVKVEETTGCIECPGLNCKQLLDPLSCKCIISKTIFEKWCDHLCDSTVLGSESCYCPYQDCSVLVLNECRDKLTKIKCPNCKKSFCFLCKIPWHAGYQCNESRHLRDRNDILVGELIEEKKWTRCYNCGHSVERVSGCRDMKYAGLGFAINVEDHSILALVGTGAVELFFVIYSFLWCYQLYATSYILKYIHATEGRLSCTGHVSWWHVEMPQEKKEVKKKGLQIMLFSYINVINWFVQWLGCITWVSFVPSLNVFFLGRRRRTKLQIASSLSERKFMVLVFYFLALVLKCWEND